MDEREVEDGDRLGVSLGDPAAVEGEDSAAEWAFRLRAVRAGTAVEAIVQACMFDLKFRGRN
jgi:hypothetical protein